MKNGQVLYLKSFIFFTENCSCCSQFGIKCLKYIFWFNSRDWECCVPCRIQPPNEVLWNSLTFQQPQSSITVRRPLEKTAIKRSFKLHYQGNFRVKVKLIQGVRFKIHNFTAVIYQWPKILTPVLWLLILKSSNLFKTWIESAQP